MYRNGAMGGGAVGILAVTGYAAPTATLAVVGVGAAVIGGLLAWRSRRHRSQDAVDLASGEDTPRS
ncbi:LPXTG-motif cell wall-anchored protein [Microbacterium proteolyticum]|uniref:LPXTG-motif cell wall-anchored protein n=1 Tax=Microbacterium proteolyticum TaxID=1572644 RepID=A0A7W5CFK5_9MICO|nr:MULTISPECIES: LPXTG cell wall anchor domain-containing protein [Microbacterium]MBB3156781.1 LPXTG-motif cell wall-anchored protein [Microbacterium proteolyticum]